MPKVNVYLPDELAEAVKDAGLPVSAICQRALEQAVRRVTAIRETVLGDMEPDAERLKHFSERARAAIKLAVEQANAEEAAVVGTEHLLRGLLAEGGNLALHVLRALEIEPDQVRHELDRRLAENQAAAADEAGPRFSGSAAMVFEFAVSEAIAMGHNYVGCEHLLLGLVVEPDGTGGHVLRALGAEQRLTRRAVSAAIAGYVHLRAQGQAAGGGAPAPTDVRAALTAAVRQELAPIVRRMERLEQRLDAGDD